MAIAVTTTPSQIRPLVTSPQRSSTPSHPQPEPWLICIWLWQKSPFCAKPFLKSLFAPVGHGRFSTSQVFCAKIPTVKFAPMGALNSKFCMHNGARSFPHHGHPSRSAQRCGRRWCPLLLSLCCFSTSSPLSFDAACIVFGSRFHVSFVPSSRQSAIGDAPQTPQLVEAPGGPAASSSMMSRNEANVDALVAALLRSLREVNQRMCEWPRNQVSVCGVTGQRHLHISLSSLPMEVEPAFDTVTTWLLQDRSISNERLVSLLLVFPRFYFHLRRQFLCVGTETDMDICVGDLLTMPPSVMRGIFEFMFGQNEAEDDVPELESPPPPSSNCLGRTVHPWSQSPPLSPCVPEALFGESDCSIVGPPTPHYFMDWVESASTDSQPPPTDDNNFQLEEEEEWANGLVAHYQAIHLPQTTSSTPAAPGPVALEHVD